MTRRFRLLTCVAVMTVTAAGTRASGAPQTASQAKPAAPQAPFDITKTNMILDVVVPGEMGSGKYDQAAKSCEEIIVRARDEQPTPEILKILIRAYEAQGRARINVRDGLKAAYDDFYNLLCLEPNHRLTEPVSDTELEEFQKVKDSTLGHVSLSMDPKGIARLEREKTEGQSYPLSFELDKEPKTIDLVAGQYKVVATQEGGSYEQFEDTLTVAAGAEVKARVLTLVRKTSKLSVVTIPAGVEVFIDDRSVGRTAAADGSAARAAITNLQPATETKAAVAQAPKSGALTLEDLAPQAHTLKLQLKCFKPIEIPFTLVRKGTGEVKDNIYNPGDLSADTFAAYRPEAVQDGAFHLVPATSAVKLQGQAGGATLWLDGERQKSVPAEAMTMCDGQHTLEVRGPKGRFIDSRFWTTSDTDVKLDVKLRGAFAISNLPAAQGLTDPAQKRAVETLKDGVLLYVPYEKELADASKDQGALPDFWSPNPTDGISKDGKTRRWRDLAKNLEAQGLAAVTADPANPAIVRVSLLAPGSSVASVLSINTADPASVDEARAATGAGLPPFWRRTAGLSAQDVDHVHGAVIVRVPDGGAAARAGLKAGSTIVSAGGAAIDSVADWDAALNKTAPGAELAIEVKGQDPAAMKIVVGVEPTALAFAPGAAAVLRGSPLPANVALVNLQAALSASATTPGEKAVVQAASVNLALVHRHLGNWQAALEALNGVDVAELGDGGGISAGTIAYLKGLCDESLNKDTDAQVEFKKAAAAKLARLDAAGPLVWPLAQLKIHK